MVFLHCGCYCNPHWKSPSASLLARHEKRLSDEGNETVTNCNGLKMTAADGKRVDTMREIPPGGSPDE